MVKFQSNDQQIACAFFAQLGKGCRLNDNEMSFLASCVSRQY